MSDLKKKIKFPNTPLAEYGYLPAMPSLRAFKIVA